LWISSGQICLLDEQIWAFTAEKRGNHFSMPGRRASKADDSSLACASGWRELHRPLLLNLDVETCVVQRLDQLRGIKVTSHLEGILFRRGGVALDAIDFLEHAFDGGTALIAAVVDAGDRYALDLALFRAAVVLHRQVFVFRLPVEAALGQRIQRLLGGLGVGGGDRYRFLLLVALPLDPFYVLEDSAHGLHTVAAAEVDVRQLHRGFSHNSTGPSQRTSQACQHDQSRKLHISPLNRCTMGERLSRGSGGLASLLEYPSARSPKESSRFSLPFPATRLNVEHSYSFFAGLPSGKFFHAVIRGSGFPLDWCTMTFASSQRITDYA